MRRLAPLALLLALVSCGGGGGGSTSPSQQPYTQTVTGTVATFDINFHPLSVPRNGNGTVVLTWTEPVDLDMYLTSTACTGYPPTACSIIAKSDSSAGQRESISRPVVNGETYKLWVDNLSTTRSASYTLTFTIQ